MVKFMLRQTKVFWKSRSGVSELIGYVLLVAIAVVMGGILYMWMKSYVPQEKIECPDGTSIGVKSYFYNCTGSVLNITLVNNGRFDIAGYIIKASDNPEKQATISLIDSLVNTGNVYKFREAVLFAEGNNNSFYPGNEITHIYNLNNVGPISTLEITPARWQERENKRDFANCGAEKKIKEILSCSS